MTAKNLSLPELPLVVIPHPLGGLKEEDVHNKADNLLEYLISKLCVKE
jgi:predicted dienelactone hydrolase